MPRRTEQAALGLAALVVVAIAALAFAHRTVPAELPVALIALVTASAGIAQPPAVSQLLERLAAGLTPAPEQNPYAQQLAAQVVADHLAQQQQPPAPPPAPPAAPAQQEPTP